MHSNVISKALAQQKIRKFRQTQAAAQIRNGSQDSAHNNYNQVIKMHGEHSLSQDLTQASSDPLNNTTTLTTTADINNSHLNVSSHLERLIVQDNSHKVGGKKLDSNMFTLYRSNQNTQNLK